MKLSMEEISSVEKKITVTIEKEQVAKEYTNVISLVAKNASVKGFRKGKTPKSVVESVYGAKIVDDVIEKLIKGTFEDAMNKKELKPVASPRISFDDFNKEGDFVYTMIVELMPEFELGDYSKFSLKRKSVEVTDEELDNTIKKLCEQQAVFKETSDDKEIANGDMVILDFKGTLPSGEAIRDGEKENFSLVIGSNSLIPGFEDSMVGLKKGEEKDFVVTFPETYFEKEYAGVDAKFHVNIKEIKEKELPEINDDFAKDLGDYENLDALKAFVKENLAKEKERSSASNLREQIITALLDTHKFDVPSAMTNKQLDYMVQEAKQRYQQQGADEAFLTTIEKDMRENSRDLASNIVRRELILGRIIEAEELIADDSDIEAKYNDIAASLARSVDEVKKYYKSIKAEQYLKEEVLTQKLFDKFISEADIEEVA